MSTMPALEKICAILPHYTPKGDSTLILTSDRQTLIFTRTVKSTIKQLARQQAIDLARLKAKSSSATHRAILQPLPLSEKLILATVKVRKPQIAGDTSMGFINLHTVTEIHENKPVKGQSIIQLNGGHHVHSLWTAATVKKHLHDAQLLSLQPSLRLREDSVSYSHELAPIAQKLVEVIYDILSLKQS